MTALIIMFICIIILFNLGPILNKLFEPKKEPKPLDVEKYINNLLTEINEFKPKMEEHNITWGEKTKNKHSKRYKVEMLQDNDQSEEAIEIDGKKYKIIEL
jgi:hypothetical protein